MFLRPSLLLITALGLASPVAGWARSGDHDRALQALQSGEVMPLQQALDRLARTHPGQVLAVELERENGQWVYEIRLLREGGRLARVELDARTGQLLRIKEREQGHR